MSEQKCVTIPELDVCPNCAFGKEAFEEHAKRMLPRFVAWENYKPLLYKDRLLGKWVIECLNCGMEVIFSEDEHGTAVAWNHLPRERGNAMLKEGGG